MIFTRQLGIGSAILALLGSASPLWADQETAAGSEREGGIDKIEWGQHWAGPEVSGAGSLEGKVVLLKMWGG